MIQCDNFWPDLFRPMMLRLGHPHWSAFCLEPKNFIVFRPARLLDEWIFRSNKLTRGKSLYSTTHWEFLVWHKGISTAVMLRLTKREPRESGRHRKHENAGTKTHRCASNHAWKERIKSKGGWSVVRPTLLHFVTAGAYKNPFQEVETLSAQLRRLEEEHSNLKAEYGRMRSELEAASGRRSQRTENPGSTRALTVNKAVEVRGDQLPQPRIVVATDETLVFQLRETKNHMQKVRAPVPETWSVRQWRSTHWTEGFARPAIERLHWLPTNCPGDSHHIWGADTKTPSSLSLLVNISPPSSFVTKYTTQRLTFLSPLLRWPRWPNTCSGDCWELRRQAILCSIAEAASPQSSRLLRFVRTRHSIYWNHSELFSTIPSPIIYKTALLDPHYRMPVLSSR